MVQTTRYEKLQEQVQELLLRTALLDDGLDDLTKHVAEIESRAVTEKQRSNAMLICILSCMAVIIGGVAQGLLTGFFP